VVVFTSLGCGMAAEVRGLLVLAQLSGELSDQIFGG
jgi:hypothetical protein